MIKSPNYTQIPNEYFDVIMRQLNGSENLIFLAIMRKTFGWQKKKDRISYTQIMELTGIKSKETLSTAIKHLECLQLITVEKVGQKCFYSVHIIDETSTENVPVQKSNQYGNCTGTGTENVPVNQKTGTETVHTKENNINKLSKESYDKIESAYASAFSELYPNGKCVINYGSVRKRIKQLLSTLSEDDIISAINKAKGDKWIARDMGFGLMTILSDNQIQKLLNGNSGSQRQPYSQPKYRVEQGVQRVTGESKQIHVDVPEDIF